MGNGDFGITIVIPTYNRSKIIGRTLDCVLNQSCANWECIVVDDFSTDDTKDLIDKYIKVDERFHYILNERKKGANGARNTGIEHSSYDWILMLDSDDTIDANFLMKMSEVITEDIDVVTCYVNTVDKKGGQIKHTYKWECNGNILGKLLSRELYVYMDNCIIRKNILKNVGGLDENCPSSQELDLHIRISELANYKTIPETLVNYYIGSNDAMSANYVKTEYGYMYITRWMN